MPLRPLPVRILVAATVHDLIDLEGEHVHVAGVLPNHEVMPRVDLAVTAGGQGSVQAALASGLPLIGIPLQPEQDANVAFAERQGAARLVPQHAAGTSALPRRAQEMLGDQRYRESARRLQAIFASVDGPGAAANAILELIGEASAEGERHGRPGPRLEAGDEIRARAAKHPTSLGSDGLNGSHGLWGPWLPCSFPRPCAWSAPSGLGTRLGLALP